MCGTVINYDLFAADLIAAANFKSVFFPVSVAKHAISFSELFPIQTYPAPVEMIGQLHLRSNVPSASLNSVVLDRFISKLRISL